MSKTINQTKLPMPNLIFKNINDDKRYMLKDKRGVYVVFVDTICIYVGASLNLYVRTSRIFNKSCNIHENAVVNSMLIKILKHSKDIRIYIFFRHTNEQVLFLEQRLIQELEPYINKVGIPLERRHILPLGV